MHRNYTRKTNSGNFDQNDGVPGVVYILRNEAFKENWLKIGCSRHSGHIRAADMNRKASTGLPAHHVCVFEMRTLDCGRAEKAIHKVLSKYRKGPQEFFVVAIEIAKSVIVDNCKIIDSNIENKKEIERKNKNQEQLHKIEQENIERKLLAKLEKERIERNAYEARKQAAKMEQQEHQKERERAIERKKIIEKEIERKNKNQERLQNEVKQQNIERELLVKLERERIERNVYEARKQAAKLAQQQEKEKEKNIEKKIFIENEKIRKNKLRTDVICPACSTTLTIPNESVQQQKNIRCPICSNIFNYKNSVSENIETKVKNFTKFSPNFIQTPIKEEYKKNFIMRWDFLIVFGIAVFLIYSFNSLTDSSTSTLPMTAVENTALLLQEENRIQQQALYEAANKIAKNYPYLDVKVGSKAVGLIVKRRDELIAAGVEPMTALLQAADEIAPRYKPKR